MNLIDVTSKLAIDEQCVAFLEKVRWPNGVRCPICGGDKISRVQRKNPGKNKRQWFLAVALMADAKKGMSASQMARQLKVSCWSAWYLAHRIRKAMEGKRRQPFIVRHGRRVDETYIGGRHHSHGVRKQTRIS
jgi:hypothetical protein